MEEFVGGLWDKLITRTAYRGFPKARIELKEIERIAPIFFRALGGDAGLTVRTGSATTHGARRKWLERVAGVGEKQELAWTDESSVYLPTSIDVFPQRAQNRELYLWLLALAAHDVAPDAAWIVRNQAGHACDPGRAAGTGAALSRTGGRRSRTAPRSGQAQRNRTGSRSGDPRCADRSWLGRTPSSQASSRLRLCPCGCTHSRPSHPASSARPSTSRQPAPESKSATSRDARKRRAERVDMPQASNPFMLLFRAESLFSWAEFIKVDRPLDEDENEHAEKAANDLDILSIADDDQTAASRVRFDLDLPAEADDDLKLVDGILLPEWNYRKLQLQPAHCRLQMMLARDAVPCALPQDLRAPARRLRKQFQTLTPQRTRLHAQVSGNDLDIDACVRFATDKAGGAYTSEPGLYIDSRQQQRDLSCLLLADLSLSTDAWVNNSARVIEVIRDSLLLFGEALAATGDHFALYGFSSVRRDNIRFHLLKGFDERYDDRIRGRLAALKPGYYTRMGAAIRHATAILTTRKTARRLLLILTDGKPNDLDKYEGRYGIEDTRMAIIEARRQGLTPFCVTIDEKAGDYLPHLFGATGYVVVHDAAMLPRVLPGLYARLTENI